MLEKIKSIKNHFKKYDEMYKTSDYISNHINNQIRRNLGHLLVSSKEQLASLVNSRMDGQELTEKEKDKIIKVGISKAISSLRVNFDVVENGLFLGVKGK